MPEENLSEISEAIEQEEKRELPPAQFNLLTGQAELIAIEVPEPQDWGTEVRIDEGICLIKSEDGSQLILSGYGLFLSKKSERILIRKGKDVIYQFPFFRLHEVVVGSKGITISSDIRGEGEYKAFSFNMVADTLWRNYVL